MEMFLLIAVCTSLALTVILLVIFLSQKNKTLDMNRILSQFQTVFSKQLDDIKQQNADNSYQLRREVMEMFKILGDQFNKTLLDTSKSNSDSMEKLRFAVDLKLKEISETSEKRLEQIRATVDEQLQDTLQKRLTGSFKQVSDQLEQVFKSMGEVRSLATGVGDLKRILSNVKIRGTWGEMQLGALISSVLSPAQYAKNVNVKGNQERVDFAIVLPGQANEKLFLPVDSKFPLEDFIKKEEILSTGNKDLAKDAMKVLAKSIITEAKRICGKYINPPVTTDFAIMYLPTEGLYADAISLGIFDICQREYHVTIAGPSTLTALLNSLQMGFRTLAIERQSGEILKMLESARKSFSDFTMALDRTKKNLTAAQNNLEEASRKSRTIQKQLQNIDQPDNNLSLETEESDQS